MQILFPNETPEYSGRELTLAFPAMVDGQRVECMITAEALEDHYGAASPRLEDMSLEDVECLLIKKALARFDGNVSQAAGALGLSRSALYRRLQRYGM